MIRLLKYDWKRNATFLLCALVLFAAAEIGIELFINDNEAALALMIMGYVALLVIVTVFTVRTYARNIISSSRRMLPVSSLQHILSPLVMGLLGSLIVGLVFLLHVSLSSTFKSFEPFQILMDFHPGTMILVVAGSLETAFFQFLVFFLAYTIGRSFYTKGRAAIMVIAYLILQNGLSWIEGWFGLQDFGLVHFGLADGYNHSADPGEGVFDMLSSQAAIGSTLFELVCGILIIFVMVKLLDKRVEAK